MDERIKEQNKTIGANIRKYRKENGLSIKQLGSMCGLTEAAITNYELGRRRIPARAIALLAATLNVDAEELDPNVNKRVEVPHARLDENYIDSNASTFITRINGTTIATLPVFGFNYYNGRINRVLLKTIATTPCDISSHKARFACIVPDSSMTPTVTKRSLLLCAEPFSPDYELSVKPNSICAVMVNGRFLIRRVVLIDDKQIVLMTDNDHQIITVNRGAVIILGIGVGFRSSL